MSPIVFMRSPAAAITRAMYGPMLAGGGAATSPAFCKYCNAAGTLFSTGIPRMWRSWNAQSFCGSKLAGDLLTRSSVNNSVISRRENSSREPSSDQPEQQQIVDDRVRQVAGDPIEVDDDRIERFRCGLMTDLRRDVERVIVQALEVGLLQVLRDLALAQLVLAAGLGDVRQMRVFGQRKA